jgi:hypothetical protein
MCSVKNFKYKTPSTPSEMKALKWICRLISLKSTGEAVKFASRLPAAK